MADQARRDSAAVERLPPVVTGSGRELPVARICQQSIAAFVDSNSWYLPTQLTCRLHALASDPAFCNDSGFATSGRKSDSSGKVMQRTWLRKQRTMVMPV